MRYHAKLYVATIALIAALWTVLLFWHGPSIPAAMINDALILCGLAIAAELLRFLMPVSATGSMGVIPYFAAGIVVPGWPSVVCVILVKSAVELWTRRAPIKAVLNLSSHAVAELVVVSVYLLLGGVSLHAISGVHDLTHVTYVAGIPA